MPGIDGERGQDRVDLVEEALAERVVVLGDLGRSRDLDALGRQLRRTSRKIAECSAMSSRTRGRAADELFGRRPAIRSVGDRAGLDLLAQAGDADLEELVEVAGEDGQEPRRSSRGLRSSRASWRTRALNSSHDSSRLRYGSSGLGFGARRGRGETTVGSGRALVAGLDGGHRASVDLRGAAGRTHAKVPGLAGEDSTSP